MLLLQLYTFLWMNLLPKKGNIMFMQRERNGNIMFGVCKSERKRERE